MNWQRILFILSLALAEVAPAALVVTLAGGNAWAVLFVIALLGALLGRLIERWLPEHVQQPALLLVAILLGLWAVKGALVGNYNLLAGWNSLAALATLGSFAYVTLLATIYIFWRGSLLAEHDSVSIGKFFTRSIFALIVILTLGAVSSALNGGLYFLAGLQLMSFFGGGLLAIALAHMADDQGSLRHLEWRGVVTLAATIGAMLGGGLLVASLFGGFALTLLSAMFQTLAFVIALILTPFAFVLAWILEGLVALMGDSAFAQMLAQRAQQLTNNSQQLPEQTQGLPWLSSLLNMFCFVIPILIIVAFVLLRRRRRRTTQTSNEQRESLLSWESLRADLGDLFGGLRGHRGETGLHGALARLKGNDPASRIRRSYIRLLLAAEAREHPRAASQTPHEYAPAAASAVGAANQPVEILTNAYERARYAPQSASEAEAEQAEQIWKQIGRDT